MVNRKNSIDASSVLSEESRSSEAGSSGSVVLGDEPKPYYDDFDDEEGRLDFEHLSNFTAEPKKKEDSETWYLTVLAAVLVYHKEDAVGDLWAYLLKLQTQDDGERQLGIIAKRLRDACLKCAVFAGFPRVCMSCDSLMD
ncbi:hypothetical protein KEM55_007234 [Ascosphaera atra]|nr:hypothetical protein KEM55_007234 [Ascosphaera atra]